MAVAGGPNLSENGLVFYYDTDNGKSYKGEPATNSQDPDYAAFTQAGFDAWGCYDGSNSHLWDVNQSKTFRTILGPDGYPTNVMLYHNFTGGFHGPTHWSGVPAALLTAGSNITVQGWVKAADAASVGKTVTPYLYYNKIGGGSYSSGTNYALTEQWQLVSHSYTVPEGSTGTGIMYFFTQNPSSVKMYLTKTAIVGGKLHAVQWLPGATTRSATQSLYDFISDSALDVSNVSFDSNADITFDGTDDKIQFISSNWAQAGEDITVEAIIYREGPSEVTSQYSSIVNATNDAPGIYSFSFYVHPTNQTLGGWLHNGTSSTSFGFAYTIEYDTWYHVAFTLSNGSTYTAKTYVNGVEQSSDTSAAGARFTNITKTTIGAYVDRNQYEWNGDIPLVKIYNRALTAEEVQNNFNGIRSRFGI